MNKRCLIKLKHSDEQVDLMHYVVYKGDVVALTKENSNKVDFVEKKGTLNVSFNVDKQHFEELDVEIITDKSYVEEVFNYMIQVNNAYFTDSYDDLAVFKIKN